MMYTSSQYEYSYQNSKPHHHHAYLIKPLLEMISTSEKFVQEQQKTRILDIGCGNGSFSNLIAQHGYEVVGIEESESGVKFASHAFPDCRFIQGSIYNLPYTELGEKFDIVIASEVIEHLFYRERQRAGGRRQKGILAPVLCP